MQPAIETSGLVRRFGDITAVAGIDLLVPRGSFYGFVGPNGAGKSTTIKCLTGLLRPSGGSMRILGLDPSSEELAIKRRIGVLPEEHALFERLTASETLLFVGRVHGLAVPEIERRSRELLEMLDLTGAAASLTADFSHGMRKKLALATALLPAPQLLFLDEPFEGIDAVASHQIKDLLAGYVAGGGTVFLTSHILEIVERLATDVGIIHRGRLVAQGALSQLRAQAPGASLEDLFLGLVSEGRADSPSRLEWLR